MELPCQRGRHPTRVRKPDQLRLLRAWDPSSPVHPSRARKAARYSCSSVLLSFLSPCSILAERSLHGLCPQGGCWSGTETQRRDFPPQFCKDPGQTVAAPAWLQGLCKRPRYHRPDEALTDRLGRPPLQRGGSALLPRQGVLASVKALPGLATHLQVGLGCWQQTRQLVQPHC